MFVFCEPDLEPAPLSALSPNELKAIGSSFDQGARCFLFPAQGDDWLCVNVPFHEGYINRRQPIDLDASVLVDMLHTQVTPLSDWIHLANPYPPGSPCTLPHGFCIFFSPSRGMDAAPNRSLALYFLEPYVIHGNILGAQFSVDGLIVEDVDESKIELVRHVVVSSMINYRAAPGTTVTASNYQLEACQVFLHRRLSGRGGSGLQLPDELVRYLYTWLGFPSLAAMAGVSVYHRSLLHVEVTRRLQVLMGLPSRKFPANVLFAFLDVLDRGYALLAGRLARNLVRDIIKPCPTIDLLCPTQSIRPVEEALAALGYSFTGLEAAVFPFMEDSVCDVRVFEGPGSMVFLVRCRADTAFQTLLRSSNTSLLNALSGTRVYSYYPELTRAGVGLVMKHDPAFAVINPDIELQEANDRWAVPCGTMCPATWRKTIGDRALMRIIWRSSWSLNDGDTGPSAKNCALGDVRWGSPDSEKEIPSFVETCWEDNAGALMWKVFDRCSNIWCSNYGI
ncbi:hypothetical protein BKA70DRAFT_1239334 [Coprinopsis sp. MPI-PUGE-AT-0042]|nr:hypothetical protein BKA70DRAFT_1239334 [Coprinopsis sp. MPI-PUGE-AT-0042]